MTIVDEVNNAKNESELHTKLTSLTLDQLQLLQAELRSYPTEGERPGIQAPNESPGTPNGNRAYALAFKPEKST